MYITFISFLVIISEIHSSKFRIYFLRFVFLFFFLLFCDYKIILGSENQILLH